MKKIKTFEQHINESADDNAINSITDENLDLIWDEIIKNPEVSIRAFSALKKDAPLLFKRLLDRAKAMGKADSIDTQTDLGDLGF